MIVNDNTKSVALNDEINVIQDVKLREIVRDYLDTVVPAYFYVIPASTSGKYHPKYTLGVGGLVKHTKAAVKIADDLLSLEQYAPLWIIRDDIIAALIIHDTFKCGTGSNLKTVSNHPKVASSMFSQFAYNKYSDFDYEVILHICALVESHMGQWNDYGNLPKPSSAGEKFVHLCDYLASRRYITVEGI